MTSARATPIWKSIANTLKAEIAAGQYRPGDRLPTEATLASRFDVNRHTIRHALADLAREDLVRSRRGAGVYVRAVPTEYPLGRRVRFHQNITGSGRLASRKILRLETRVANQSERDALSLNATAPVHICEGLSFSDGTVIAHFLSAFPAERFPRLLDGLSETASVTEAFRLNGLDDYLRGTTRITAEAASATEARHLDLREGAPLLRSVAVNVDLKGMPVEYGTTSFAGDRVTLTLAQDDGELG